MVVLSPVLSSTRYKLSVIRVSAGDIYVTYRYTISHQYRRDLLSLGFTCPPAIARKKPDFTVAQLEPSALTKPVK